LSSIKYRPEIDGLRAIAVIPVILFHFSNDLLPGGYIGVDVFFVISGFLVTSIILDEYERDVFVFSNFWLRRVRRILPALMAMVLATLVAGTLIDYGANINNLGTQGLASLLSFSNISHWLIAGNYWGSAAENSALLHTWSLSVEEQFYLFFPLLLFVVLKYFHKWVALIFFVLSLSSVLLFFFGTQTHPSATFYLLPTRAWELGVGAMLAITLFKGHIQFNNKPALSVIGLLVVLMSYFFISGKEGISPLLVIPVFGAALIIAFARNTDNIVNRFLSISPVVYIGKISYSLYLWHWPILVFSKQLALTKTIVVNPIVTIVIIFIISALSYRIIEVPTRRNKKVVPYVLAVLLVGVVSSYCLKVGDYAEDISSYNKTEWHGEPYNVSPVQEWSKPIGKRMIGITIPHSDCIDVNAYKSGGIKKIYGTKNPDIVVLGDSHSMMWAKVLDEIAKELSTSISFYSADGTPTFFSIPPVQEVKGTRFFSANEKYLFDSARLKSLAEWKPKVVVIVSRWDGQHKKNTSDLIRYIGSIGSKALLIEQPPVLFFGDKNAPQYLSYLGMSPINGSKQYIDHANSSSYQNGVILVKQIAEECDYCIRVAISDLYLDNDKVWVIDSNDVLYIDDDHLSYSGALKAKDRIAGALKKLIQ